MAFNPWAEAESWDRRSDKEKAEAAERRKNRPKDQIDDGRQASVGYRVPGSRALAPGTRVGKLVILGPDVQESWLGRNYSERNHRCKCDCGKVIVEPYNRLYYQSAYSCGCVPKPKATMMCRPEVDETGKMYGPRTVTRWVAGYGWECVCEECGGLEYYRYTRVLELARHWGCWKDKVIQPGFRAPRGVIVWRKDTPIDL